MADASARARLEAAQARRSQLAKELARELPVSPEHQQVLDERSRLSLEVSTLEGRLAEAIRREDELVEQRARGWSVLKGLLSVTVSLCAALLGVLGYELVTALGKGTPRPVALACGLVALAVPVLVTRWRWRRGKARAELSRRLRDAPR